MLAPWKKSYEKYKQYIQKQRHHFANKGPYSQSYGFSSSHVWMWELDHKEGWAQELAEELMFSNCGAGEDSWESPLDCNEIKQVSPKGNQPWVYIGRTDAEAEAPILWPLVPTHWKGPLCGERLRERGEGGERSWDCGWHHWFNGCEFEQTPGNSEGRWRLACCSPFKESDMTEWLNNNWEPVIKYGKFSSVLCDALEWWDGDMWEGSSRGTPWAAHI